MDAFLAFLIVFVVLFFMFLVLPNLLSTHVSAQARPYVPRQPAEAAPPVQQQPDPAAQSRVMLDSFYKNASEHVPEDFPQRPIGACPMSKPPSTDLPIVDTPMCVSVTVQRRFKDMAW